MDLMLTTRYLDDLAGLGVTVPAKSQTAREVYEAAIAAAAAKPSDALKQKLEAGELTPDNVGSHVRDAALELGAQQNAHQIVRDLGLTIHRAIREGLREEVARIHAELKATFAPAAAGIAKAAAHFGPDATADEVVRMKPEAVKMWNQTSGYMSTLDAVSIAYRTLLVDVLRTPVDRQVTLFVTEILHDVNDLNSADELYRVRGSWLALAHAGYTLTLNTVEEANQVDTAQRARIAAIEAEKKAARVAGLRFSERFTLGAGK